MQLNTKIVLPTAPCRIFVAFWFFRFQIVAGCSKIKIGVLDIHDCKLCKPNNG
jgi:hypothetical protein